LSAGKAARIATINSASLPLVTEPILVFRIPSFAWPFEENISSLLGGRTNSNNKSTAIFLDFHIKVVEPAKAFEAMALEFWAISCIGRRKANATDSKNLVE
jgi:hypothetical protein